MKGTATTHILRCPFAVIVLLFFPLSAQNGSWWQPSYPISGDTITIYFDPIQNNEIPDDISSLVLHWGVNETAYGSWQQPPQNLWPPGTVLHSDAVAARSPMTKESETLWRVDIPTDTSIHTLHYVINDGTPSFPGTHWGHNQGEPNWNIRLFQARLTTVIIKPQVENPYEDPLRSPVFAASDGTVEIVVSAVVNATELASLTLFVEQSEVAQETTTDTLRYEFVAAQHADGATALSAVATDTSGIADTMLFYIMVNPEPGNIPSPPGIVEGINYDDSSTVTLVLFAPFKEFVYVIGDFNDWRIDTDYYMNQYQPSPDSSLWWIEIPGLVPSEEYAYQYLVDGDIRIADPYAEKLLDPWNDKYISSTTYPNLRAYPTGKTKEPVSIFQTSQKSFTWAYTDSFRRPPAKDLVIYELLVRDFIGTHDYQTMKDTLDYLENLGINAIELMPITEFEGNSSWGYNSSFYFAPDKYYGTSNGLKEFIDECHRRGIAVILDLVLNHSYGQSPLVRLYWNSQNNRPSVHNPWYNQVSPNPVFAWGYDFDHESPHTQAFVDRVNRHWLMEYRVDGFRFDFTKGFTNTAGDGGAYDAARIAILKRMAHRIWEMDSTYYVILEHFAANSEERELAQSGMLLWGNLNYNYNEATMGWHDRDKSDFSWIIHKKRGWLTPHVVGYMESHDEERLNFKNLQYGNSSGNYDVQKLETALQRMELVGAFFFTVPGPKMIWQFGELGYDVSIDYTCRTCEKPIRWNYLDDPRRRKLYLTWSTLINLRKKNEIFRNGDIALGWNFTGPAKRLTLRDSTMNVTIIGNFGVTTQSINPAFHHAGIWYDYFSGDSMLVSETPENITLEPGEFFIYTDVPLEPPDPGVLGISREAPSLIPGTFALHQNYPNPFNTFTQIDYVLSETGDVSLVIYDILGRKMKTLFHGINEAGNYSVTWDGTDVEGETVASGVYFYSLTSENRKETKKLLLLR